MAKCEEGYLCDVCGGDVEEITDSDLYLRFVIGMIDPETLHTTRERHIRCNPVLAQFIVDDDFEPLLVEGEVIRYELPHLGALNFVVRRPAGSSVTRTLALDAHGKSLSSALLDLEIP